MEKSDTSFLVHTCYLFKWDQKLPFDTGSANFTMGKSLYGATSHATGLVKTVSGTTTGYLILSNVQGTFQDNEVITDTNTPAGTALVNGTPQVYKDGGKGQTKGTRKTRCKFLNSKPPQGKIPDNWTGRFPTVMFAPGVVITEGMKLYTSALSFVGTYTVLLPVVPEEDSQGKIHHVTVGLQKVTA